MSSKMIAHQKEFFSKMVVDAVCSLDYLLALNMIGIKKVQGGSLEVCPLYSGTCLYWSPCGPTKSGCYREVTC